MLCASRSHLETDGHPFKFHDDCLVVTSPRLLLRSNPHVQDAHTYKSSLYICIGYSNSMPTHLVPDFFFFVAHRLCCRLTHPRMTALVCGCLGRATSVQDPFPIVNFVWRGPESKQRTSVSQWFMNLFVGAFLLISIGLRPRRRHFVAAVACSPRTLRGPVHLFSWCQGGGSCSMHR